MFFEPECFGRDLTRVKHWLEPTRSGTLGAVAGGFVPVARGSMTFVGTIEAIVLLLFCVFGTDALAVEDTLGGRYVPIFRSLPSKSS